MRFLRRSLVGLFLLSVTLGLLAWGANTFYQALQTRWEHEDRARPARERVFAVNVETAQPEDMVPVLTSFGKVRSQRTLDLRAVVGGRIVKLAPNFEEGGVVRAGQLLVQIDPNDAQTTLDLARADLREAEADLREATQALELARDDVGAALDQLRLRRLAMTRQQDLLSRGVGTAAAVENAELAVSSAAQVVLARRQSLASAQARHDQSEASLSRREVNLREAKRKLADTEIRARFDGTLSEVSAVEGGLVSPNERLARIVDAQALEVSFRVSTPQYTRLLDDDGALLPADVKISLGMFGVDLTTTGKISRESAVVGEGQTGRMLFAKINAPKGFRPGDFVTVTVNEPMLRNVIVLPASAVDARPSVLVLGKDDRLEEIEVSLLRRQGDDVIVRAPGLAGREVVRERSPLLGVGIKVRPARPAAQGAAHVAPGVAQTEDLIELSPERRARLVAFIESNKRMPGEAKQRLLGQLRQDKVPAKVVERIENRMGG